MKKDKNLQIRIFLYITLASFAIFVAMTFMTGGEAMQWLAMGANYRYQFLDFFRLIVYSDDLKNIYFNVGDAPYPPIVYCFFYLLNIINPIDFGDGIDYDTWLKALERNNLLIFMLLFIIICVVLYWIMEQMLEERYSLAYTRLMFISVILAPFMLDGAIERGNVIILSMMCLLLALTWKDSESKVKRELALILIAISAGIKIYPAIFGLMYLKEKRWKEAGRLIIYGCLILFVPFVFTGGLAGFKAYLNILSGFGGGYACRWVSIKDYLYSTLVVLRIDDKVPYLSVILGVIWAAYLIVAVAAFFMSRSRWKEVFYLSLILSTLVPSSYRYVAIYLILPLMMYFVDSDNEEKNLGFIVTMSVVFSVPWYGYILDLKADCCIFAAVYLCAIVMLIHDAVLLSRTKLSDSKTARQ